MTASSHALTGAAIAAVAGQPILAIPLAFASHFVCDSLPHFGVDMKFGSRTMYLWLLVDGLVALGFALLLLLLGVRQPVLLATAGFAAMSPDLAWLYYGLQNKLEKTSSHDFLARFHARIQWYQKPPGLLVECIWAALMLGVIWGVQ